MKHRVSSPTTITLTELATKRRWSASEAKEVLGALERSGEEPAAFAARHGLHPARLGRWLRARPPRGARAKVQFAEIHLARPATTTASVVNIEIERGHVRGTMARLGYPARSSSDGISPSPTEPPGRPDRHAPESVIGLRRNTHDLRGREQVVGQGS